MAHSVISFLCFSIFGAKDHGGITSSCYSAANVIFGANTRVVEIKCTEKKVQSNFDTVNAIELFILMASVRCSLLYSGQQ